MKWTKLKLSNYITTSALGKSEITLKNGGLSNATKDIILGISSGLVQSHSDWQNTVMINNIQANGGTCSALGPLITPATGIALMGLWSQKLSPNVVKSNIINQFPSKTIVELKSYFKNLCESIASGFVVSFNQWLDTTSINNIIITGGICSCQSPPSSPIGSYSNGIGNLSILEGNIPVKLQKSVIKNNIIAYLKGTVRLNESGNATKYLLQFIDSVSEGIINMHNEWLSGTQIINIQVNGGTSTFLGPLISSIGSNGVIK